MIPIKIYYDIRDDLKDGQWIPMLNPFLGISDADMDPDSIFYGMWDNSSYIYFLKLL